MEVSRIVSTRPSFFSSDVGILSSRKTSLSSSMFVPLSGFSDDGHLQYYCGGLKMKAVSTRCGGGAVKDNDLETKKNVKRLKKRLKLLKGMSKDVAFLSEMEIGWNSNVQQDDSTMMDVSKGRTRTISEATELLMGQLKQLKAEEKELKMKKKLEKAKLKAACEDSSSSSSSESSDDGKCGQVMTMSRLKEALAKGNKIEKSNHPQVASTVDLACPPENSLNQTSPSSLIYPIDPPKIEIKPAPETKMIEVCMGGKCKKLGSEALLEEFQKTVGVEIAVVGCKCMGKCRSAPNVKVHDVEQRLLVSAAASDQEGEMTNDNPQHKHSPSLFTGVSLEDVNLIASNF